MSKKSPSSPLWTPNTLREQAEALERVNVHENLGLSLTLTQTADLLRWAADQLESPPADAGLAAPQEK